MATRAQGELLDEFVDALEALDKEERLRALTGQGAPAGGAAARSRRGGADDDD